MSLLKHNESRFIVWSYTFKYLVNVCLHGLREHHIIITPKIDSDLLILPDLDQIDLEIFRWATLL